MSPITIYIISFVLGGLFGWLACNIYRNYKMWQTMDMMAKYSGFDSFEEYQEYVMKAIDDVRKE